MKKLEDFECEKVEVNTIYGGLLAEPSSQTWTDVPDQYENKFDQTDK
ncbi:hypothetical protein [Flavobacterium sp. LB1P62]